MSKQVVPREKSQRLPYLQRPSRHHSTQQKQQFMVLKQDSRLPFYDPLHDEHLLGFLSRERVQRQLRRLVLDSERKNTRKSKSKSRSSSNNNNSKNLHTLEDSNTSRKIMRLEPLKLAQKRENTHISQTAGVMSKEDFDEFMRQIRSKVQKKDAAVLTVPN